MAPDTLTITDGEFDPPKKPVYSVSSVDPVVGVPIKVKELLVTDDPTGITTTDYVQQTSDDKIYNLAGQRVSKAKNGIFIKNGKKELHR